MTQINPSSFLTGPIVSTYFSAPYNSDSLKRASNAAKAVISRIPPETPPPTKTIVYTEDNCAAIPGLTYLLTPRNQIIFIRPVPTASGSFKIMHQGTLFDRSNKSIRSVAVLLFRDSDGNHIRETSLLAILKQFCISKGQYIVPEFIDASEIESRITLPNGKMEIENTPLIIEQLCEGGTLSNLVSRNPSQEQVSYIAYQILRIVKIFLNKKLILRDIKPDNILLVNQQTLNIVMGDIGDAYKYYPNGAPDREVSQLAGTPEYFSPETARRFLETQRKESANQPSADIWAVGATIAKVFDYKPLIQYFNQTNISQASLLQHFTKEQLLPLIDKWKFSLILTNEQLTSRLTEKDRKQVSEQQKQPITFFSKEQLAQLVTKEQLVQLIDLKELQQRLTNEQLDHLSLKQQITHLANLLNKAPICLPETEPPMAQFAAQLLHPDPKQRPVVNQALQDPLLKKTLMQSPDFLSGLETGWIPIEDIYDDLLGLNTEEFEEEYKNELSNLFEQTKAEIEKQKQTPIESSASSPNTVFTPIAESSYSDLTSPTEMLTSPTDPADLPFDKKRPMPNKTNLRTVPLRMDTTKTPPRERETGFETPSVNPTDLINP